MSVAAAMNHDMRGVCRAGLVSAFRGGAEQVSLPATLCFDMRN